MNKLTEKTRVAEIWESLNESERTGVKFGLFPGDKVPLEDLSKEETVELMKLAEEENPW